MKANLRIAAVAALLVSTAAVPALAAAPAVGDPAPPIAEKDIKGREVTVPLPGTVSLVSFTSKATGEKGGAFTRAVRLDHPDINIVSIIDVSSFLPQAFGSGTGRNPASASEGRRSSAATDERRVLPIRAA